MLKTWSLLASLLTGSICLAQSKSPEPIAPPIRPGTPQTPAPPAGADVPKLPLATVTDHPGGSCAAKDGKCDCWARILRFFTYRGLALTPVQEMYEPYNRQPDAYTFFLYPPPFDGPPQVYPCPVKQNCVFGICSGGSHPTTGQNAGADH